MRVSRDLPVPSPQKEDSSEGGRIGPLWEDNRVEVEAVGTGTTEDIMKNTPALMECNST